MMIQQEMARNVTLKYTPCLTFVNDTLPESADKLHQLLDSLDIDEDTE
ncbi:MAG: hypothetical protein HRT89_16140 [Lentisphaeria bacterium]|nr:hypothetical protein [Lentisphaeria bacterium]